MLVGRGSDCDLRLDDNLSSRQHARIELVEVDGAEPEFRLSDLGSTNGTFVNGRLVEDTVVLADGDKLRVGRHVFKFAWLDEFEAEFQDRIHQMIIRDDLTNLLTQRSFFAELEAQVTRRNELPDPGSLCVLMMDLDHFKNVNDTYGHLVGSSTIKQVGEIIESRLSGPDVAGRYGGEEYIAFLPDVATDRAAQVAESIRRAISSADIVVSRRSEQVQLRVTISIGVSSYPEHSHNAVELIERADLALYRAKRQGRNRVVVFDGKVDTFEGEGYERRDLSEMLGGVDKP